jgi:hypothetical protein
MIAMTSRPLFPHLLPSPLWYEAIPSHCELLRNDRDHFPPFVSASPSVSSLWYEAIPSIVNFYVPYNADNLRFQKSF